MDRAQNPAPGGPGIPSPWTCGAKTGIGRAAIAGSEISFTIGKGILNEVYFPQEDIACIRECVFVITNGKDYFSDEREVIHDAEGTMEPGIPAYHIKNRCPESNYILEKDIISDSRRNAVLQRLRFTSFKPGLRLFACLTPHLHNHGADNDSWTGDYKGMPMLFAQSDGLALALASTTEWSQTTVGFNGVSDGYTDLRMNKRLSQCYDYAGRGNIILCGELSLAHADEFEVAIGFGHSPEEAAFQARASLFEGFESVAAEYVSAWSGWQKEMKKKWKGNTVRARWLPESIAALEIADSRRYPGGIIASLSIPWGQTQGVNGGLGYHLVWPRDLVESAWGFLALGATDNVRRIANYLFATQDSDGKWSQNMWLDGRPCLDRLQMDQVALPVLLIHSCWSRGLLNNKSLSRYLTGVRRALMFLLTFGPYTEQDRWEQQKGLSVFTIAAEIAALVSGAELLEVSGDIELAYQCRETADNWNAQVEKWTYVQETESARRLGVGGYYIRINPFETAAQDVKDQLLNLHHRPDGKGETPVGEIVSVDALALVRFGLRRPDDPRILDTIRVIDEELRRELPGGSCWRRFTNDGYGETDAGEPFETIGIGRSWPLLTGERAHYEIAAGHFKKAKRLLRAMENFSHNGLLPEQVWDADDIPEKNLYKGQYTGSAMPLTWAQAEYIKLCVSLKQRRVFDLPSAAAKRYLGAKARYR